MPCSPVPHAYWSLHQFPASVSSRGLISYWGVSPCIHHFNSSPTVLYLVHLVLHVTYCSRNFHYSYIIVWSRGALIATYSGSLHSHFVFNPFKPVWDAIISICRCFVVYILHSGLHDLHKNHGYHSFVIICFTLHLISPAIRSSCR